MNEKIAIRMLESIYKGFTFDLKEDTEKTAEFLRYELFGDLDKNYTEKELIETFNELEDKGLIEREKKEPYEGVTIISLKGIEYLEEKNR